MWRPLLPRAPEFWNIGQEIHLYEFKHARSVPQWLHPFPAIRKSDPYALHDRWYLFQTTEETKNGITPKFWMIYLMTNRRSYRKRIKILCQSCAFQRQDLGKTKNGSRVSMRWQLLSRHQFSNTASFWLNLTLPRCLVNNKTYDTTTKTSLCSGEPQHIADDVFFRRPVHNDVFKAPPFTMTSVSFM